MVTRAAEVSFQLRISAVFSEESFDSRAMSASAMKNLRDPNLSIPAPCSLQRRTTKGRLKD